MGNFVIRDFIRKKIGLLGGTFDPVHHGHLNLAVELMEKRALDQVWFIPAQMNPHKVDRPPVSMEHRLAMVQLAIQEVPQFILKDLEKNHFPSYTIETLKIFLAEEAVKETPHQFYWLMGEDALSGFHHWHLPEEIIRLVPLLIGSRYTEKQDEVTSRDPEIERAIQEGLTPTRLMDISSREIRKRLALRLYCGYLVPTSVLHYIEQHHLYQFVYN